VAETARFEFTIDDLLDVGERSLSRSKVVRDMRRGGAIASAVLVAAIVFLFLTADLGVRVVVAVGAGAIAGATYPPLRRSLVRQRLHAYWRERLKGDGPFTCEVELTSEGITTRQFSTTTTIPWSAVASVSEIPQGIEIVGKKQGLIVVRERAFASPEAKRRFAEEIRRSLVP
jgi:hypothetical protein